MVHWSPTPNASEYCVSWAPVGDTVFVSRYVDASKNYSRIIGLEPDTEYQIKIRSVSYDVPEGNSAFSPAITLTTASTPFVKVDLDAPTVSARGIASDSICVEWEANPRATGYTVAYKEKTADSYTTINVSASETRFVLSDLAADTNYYVKVRALGDGSFWSNSSYGAPKTVKTKDASFLSSAEYEQLRQRYDELTTPESMADVNIVIPTDWTAAALLNAIEIARSTPGDDVILLDPSQYSLEPLDLSEVSITLDVDYETSGAISILSRGMDRAEIKVNDSESTFHAVAGWTQFGGFDFIDVNPEVSAYQATVSPAMGIFPTTVVTQSVGMYTPAGISIGGGSKDFEREAPTVSANPSASDYALLFVGGGNAENNVDEFYVTLRDYYYDLVEDFSLDPAKIYILYADGNVDGTSKNRLPSNSARPTTSDMSFATSTGAHILSATGANLTSTLAEIASLMTADSHLFFYTEDHGDGRKNRPSNYDDYLWGWNYLYDSNNELISELIDGITVRDALFQIQEGYVTCVFTQCFSGGILDDIFDLSTYDPSTGACSVSSAYTGSAHFAGGASANHYEPSQYRMKGTAYIGYPQTFAEAMRQYSTGVEAFAYTEQNEPFSAKVILKRPEDYAPNQGNYNVTAEHPWHVGEAFPIFTTSVGQIAPTINSHEETPDSISLTWEAIQGADSYVVEYYAVGAEAEVVTVKDISATSYTIEGLIPETNYSLRVKANNSSFSVASSLWTKPGVKETPSTVVTTDLDVVYPYDGLISLREAISKYSVPGDTITFDSSLQGKTIKLNSNNGELTVNKSLTIDASNLYDADAQTPGLTISGENSSRVARLAGGASLTVKGVEFANGYVKDKGGAIYNGGDLAVENCVFRDNYATDANSNLYYGGAIAVQSGATLAATTTVFSGNVGAGVVSFQTNLPSSLTDCVFENNEARGLYVVSGKVTMTNCVVRDNADSGIDVAANGELEAINCLVVGNTATWGAGIELFGTATLYNCAITGNTASNRGGGGGVDVNDGAVLNAYNTIIAGNTARNGADVDLYNGFANGYNVLSSFAGWTSGANNLTHDASAPLFNDAANGDYSLADNSQAINKGNNVYVKTSVDLAGEARISGNSVDIGAYEYQIVATPLDTPEIYGTGVTANSIYLIWGSVDHAAGYKVEYRLVDDPNSEWTTWSESITATEETIAGLSEGTLYAVRVTALSGEQMEYVDSAPDGLQIRTPVRIAPAPTITVDPGVNQATVSWNAVEHASGYSLSHKKTDDPDVESSWTVNGDIPASDTSVTVDGLEGAISYDFKLVAKGDGTHYVDSDSSDVVAQIIKEKLEPPTISVVSEVVDSATVGWTAVEKASGYTLYYKKSSESNWSVKGGIPASDTSATITNLVGGATYDFKVVAKGDGTSYVDSDASDVATKRIARKLDAPTFADANSELDSISVSWDAVDDAVGYDVSYAPAGTNEWSNPERVDNALSWTKDVALSSTTLSQGTSFDVRVVAVATGFDVDSDEAATTVATKVLAAPTIVANNADADPEQDYYAISISWNPVDYATGYKAWYRVQGATDWGDPDTLGENATTWTKDQGLLPNTNYEFRVIATAGADGVYHSAATEDTFKIEVVPRPLDAPTITGVTQTTFAVKPNLNSATVGWNAVRNASSYTLRYKKTDDPDVEASWTVVSNIATPSYSVVNLEGATSRRRNQDNQGKDRSRSDDYRRSERPPSDD